MRVCAGGTRRAGAPTTSSRSSRSWWRPTQELEPDYNVAPTEEVYAVIDRRPRHAEPEDAVRRELAVVRWGLVPSWAKDPSIGSRLINARMETVADKPAFRKAFARRRCLLPADGYYEWYIPQDGPTLGEEASRSSSRSSSIRPTAACSRWPGSTSSGATRPARPTTRSRGS